MKLVIAAGHSTDHYWRDIWRYRELMYFLAWRDLTVRYKQTVIGVTWALIRPAVTMLVFVAFRRLVDVPQGEVPEPLLVFAAVLPWQLFSSALAESSASLIGNAGLISKVYFPRLLIPAATVVTAFADFLITLGLLALLMLWYGIAPGWSVLALPFFAALAACLALGLGFLLAALNVKYRDFRYIVPFLIQVGLFVSPIAFTTAHMPERWKAAFMLNPLVGIIDGFRWSILGSRLPFEPAAVWVSAVLAVSSLLFGVWYFRRVERSFADVI